MLETGLQLLPFDVDLLADFSSLLGSSGRTDPSDEIVSPCSSSEDSSLICAVVVLVDKTLVSVLKATVWSGGS